MPMEAEGEAAETVLPIAKLEECGAFRGVGAPKSHACYVQLIVVLVILMKTHRVSLSVAVCGGSACRLHFGATPPFFTAPN